MRKFFRTRVFSFRYAFEGWWFVIRTQQNAWIHAAASILVVALALWLHIPLRDWTFIVIAIALVWIAEFMNTALEALVDLVSPQRNHLAKICKDVGAAAVLIAAGASILIGLLILGPPLWQRLAEIAAAGA